MSFVFSYESSSEEEVVLIHVEFPSCLQDFDTYLEAEKQLVDLKQTTTCVPAGGRTQLDGVTLTDITHVFKNKETPA